MITDNSSAIEDDPSDLLGRLHLAIPDLELLLRRYKETHGELGLREALVRKKEAESAEILKRKEEHINRLMNQFHDAETKHAREYNKLRLHIGNLEENMKDLEERLHVSESQRKQEAASNRELAEQKAALVRERMVIAKAASDERDQLVAEFEESKTNTQRQLDAERIRVAELITQKDDLEKQADSMKAEHEEIANSTKAELEERASAAQEKATAAQEKADQMGKEIEELKAELVAQKDASANGCEEQRSQLVAELDEQKLAMAKSQEEEIEALKKAHKDDLNEQTRAFVGLQESLNLKMTAENQSLLEEIANLKKAWDEDKIRFEKMIEELKGVAEGMEEEKGRLQKIVEQFAEETDVKSKGDLH
jgi:chromosome segregation ATPase